MKDPQVLPPNLRYEVRQVFGSSDEIEGPIDDVDWTKPSVHDPRDGSLVLVVEMSDGRRHAFRIDLVNVPAKGSSLETDCGGHSTTVGIP
jgi:hypothetical protein